MEHAQEAVICMKTVGYIFDTTAQSSATLSRSCGTSFPPLDVAVRNKQLSLPGLKSRPS